jgi:hypothetical protein
MGVPTSEVGYTSATARRGDHEVHKGHVVALENNNNICGGIRTNSPLGINSMHTSTLMIKAIGYSDLMVLVHHGISRK